MVGMVAAGQQPTGYDLRGKDALSIVPQHAKGAALTPHSGGGSQNGLKFKWTDADGRKVSLRVHDRDGTAPPNSNSGQGWTVRVQIDGQYQDEAGNLFHHQVHNPRSPTYNPEAANQTHIPYRLFRPDGE
ncbi:polymorphic toxin type 30 domain-containing protein [Kribbella sp. NPDC023855]|uniref:polymorphic toxin type 30 domain-containing protein n=1 Tax=Kribbella sp. NPDC023855 TaxID=3154698 RepID=UPI0033D16DB3